MYILIGTILGICILLYILQFFRRRHFIKKIRCMDDCEKLRLLNDAASPFGFSYVPETDIFTSTLDAWQKEFGFCQLYNQSAVQFHMVLDCEPVYFDYNGKTWMIEFWKGQYGINLGGEIGVYQADTILSPEQYDRTLFHGVSEYELFPITMKLHYKGMPSFSIHREHWWLTGFSMGHYCEPEDLVLHSSITFPNGAMMQSFTDSLKRLGYTSCEICICNHTVSFSLSIPHSWQPRLRRRCMALLSQWHNRIFCILYRFITRPFTCTLDRILYLYFYLPAAFRRLLCLKRNRKQRFSRKKEQCQ